MFTTRCNHSHGNFILRMMLSIPTPVTLFLPAMPTSFSAHFTSHFTSIFDKQLTVCNTSVNLHQFCLSFRINTSLNGCDRVKSVKQNACLRCFLTQSGRLDFRVRTENSDWRKWWFGPTSGTWLTTCWLVSSYTMMRMDKGLQWYFYGIMTSSSCLTSTQLTSTQISCSAFAHHIDSTWSFNLSVCCTDGKCRFSSHRWLHIVLWCLESSLQAFHTLATGSAL